MQTVGAIFMILDILIVTWALHKLYHSMFSVVYFGLQAYFKELVVTFIISCVIVGGGLNLLGLEKVDEKGMKGMGFGGMVYTIALFAFSVYLIIRFNKPKKN